MTWPFLIVLALLDEDLLVDAGGGVRAHELADRDKPRCPFPGRVLIFFLPSGSLPSSVTMIWLPVTEATLPASSATMHGAGIAGDALFQAGGHERRLGDEQRHGLALHVRTHQRAVGVVVLQERNQAGGHGDELLRRHVHVIHPRRLDVDEVAPCRGRRRGRSVKWPLSSIGAFACAMTKFSSRSAVR